MSQSAFVTLLTLNATYRSRCTHFCAIYDNYWAFKCLLFLFLICYLQFYLFTFFSQRFDKQCRPPLKGLLSKTHKIGLLIG